MSPQPSWQPNVPESQLFVEKTLLQEAILAAVTHGITLALFILIISLLITRLKVDIRHNGRASRRTIFLLVFVCVTSILSTLAMDFPGEPAAYQKLMFSIPISSLGNCCSFLMAYCYGVVFLYTDVQGLSYGWPWPYWG